jgi:hypothetical protein
MLAWQVGSVPRTVKEESDGGRWLTGDSKVAWQRRLAVRDGSYFEGTYTATKKNGQDDVSYLLTKKGILVVA